MTKRETRTTQEAHPWRATVRTVFAALVAFAALLPAIVGASGVDQAAPIVAAMLAVAAAVTRVMALPGVEDFLARFAPFLAADPGGYVPRHRRTP